MALPVVISIGNFDGVHQGHRAILARARELANSRGVGVLVLTFDPHPTSVLRPGVCVPRLMSLPQRVEALRQAGADAVEVLTPTPRLLSLSPQAFVEQLCAKYQPRAFVEGHDFRFGQGRKGDVETLRELGRRQGFDVAVVEPIGVVLDDLTLAAASSSLVRWLLSQGRVVGAARCLGRHYTLCGSVVRGEQRGRTLGVPTINLDPTAYEGFALPAEGVYAGLVHLHDSAGHKGSEPWAAAVSVGRKPTFADHRLTIEAHLLDFTGDLYGCRVSIGFARWLRDQQAFPNLTALTEQLGKDIAAVRRWHELGRLAPPPEQPWPAVAAT